VQWVYNEGEDTDAAVYASKLKGLTDLINPALNRKQLHDLLLNTHQVLEQKVNWLLQRVDSKETEHIDMSEKEPIQKEAIAELKIFKSVVKRASDHDWQTDFIVDLKKIQDE